jgi:hypothetical protein
MPPLDAPVGRFRATAPSHGRPDPTTDHTEPRPKLTQFLNSLRGLTVPSHLGPCSPGIENSRRVSTIATRKSARNERTVASFVQISAFVRAQPRPHIQAHFGIILHKKTMKITKQTQKWEYPTTRKRGAHANASQGPIDSPPRIPTHATRPHQRIPQHPRRPGSPPHLL